MPANRTAIAPLGGFFRFWRRSSKQPNKLEHRQGPRLGDGAFNDTENCRSMSITVAVVLEETLQAVALGVATEWSTDARLNSVG
jgi:hypothetical protein